MLNRSTEDEFLCVGDPISSYSRKGRHKNVEAFVIEKYRVLAIGYLKFDLHYDRLMKSLFERLLFYFTGKQKFIFSSTVFEFSIDININIRSHNPIRKVNIFMLIIIY